MYAHLYRNFTQAMSGRRNHLPPSRLVADDEQDTKDNTHYNMGHPTVADKEYTRLVTAAD